MRLSNIKRWDEKPCTNEMWTFASVTSLWLWTRSSSFSEISNLWLTLCQWTKSNSFVNIFYWNVKSIVFFSCESLKRLLLWWFKIKFEFYKRSLYKSCKVSQVLHHCLLLKNKHIGYVTCDRLLELCFYANIAVYIVW